MSNTIMVDNSRLFEQMTVKIEEHKFVRLLQCCKHVSKVESKKQRAGQIWYSFRYRDFEIELGMFKDELLFFSIDEHCPEFYLDELKKYCKTVLYEEFDKSN